MALRSWPSSFPFFSWGGIVGRLFREFAVVLSVAIGVSLLISLSTTRMMCARFLRHENRRTQSFVSVSENAFNRLLRPPTMFPSLGSRHQFLILLVTSARFA